MEWRSLRRPVGCSWRLVFESQSRLGSTATAGPGADGAGVVRLPDSRLHGWQADRYRRTNAGLCRHVIAIRSTEGACGMTTPDASRPISRRAALKGAATVAGAGALATAAYWIGGVIAF